MDKNLVLDVGLNVGQDTAFYLSQGYRVVAIEADPTLAQANRERFRCEIEAGKLEILNVGIAQEEGLAEFWISEGRPQFNSFHRGIAARDGWPHHSIVVPTMRFATVLERFSTPCFVKIDIEGNDMQCLTDLASRSLPQYISVESECPLNGEPASVEDGLRTLRQLHRLGYRQFKLIDQRTFCTLSLPPSFNYLFDRLARQWLQTPPLNRIRGTYWQSQRLMTRSRLERKYQREFPLGSSGPWGEETVGSWLNFGQAERAYRRYREAYFRDSTVASYSFWCDWHAKLSAHLIPSS